MNLRKAGKYAIGIDLGSASVGWAVSDLETGELFHFKGRPTWGSRLFSSANTAEERRSNRSQRRRYDRRRLRIDTLQKIFAQEISQVDEEFFIRLNQSRLFKEDRNQEFETDYRWPLFNDENFTEVDYYEKFPTIWHLRNYLLNSDEKADIRLVYLAFHNIVKCRGNFLHENNQTLSAKNSDTSEVSEELAREIVEYFSNYNEEAIEKSSIDCEELTRILGDEQSRTAEKKDAFAKALDLNDKSREKNIASACLGGKVDFAKLLFEFDPVDKYSAYIYEDEKYDELTSLCPPEALNLLEAIKKYHSAYTLNRILDGSNSISAAMIKSYDAHKAELKTVKKLIKEYCPKDIYNKMFKGAKDSRGNYDLNKVHAPSYTSYIEGEKLANGKGTSQEELLKELNSIFEKYPDSKSDKKYTEISQKLEDGTLLQKQKTRDNGAIPYQLHLEEMLQIISKQERYYPFLNKNKELLSKIVSSRIPYYVGPLNTAPDPEKHYPENKIDTSRKFGWSVRKPEMEKEKAYPWNVEEVFNKDLTAERFIQRMTGTCTYLFGEPVLPRHSLIYEEFCVLNELNGAKWSEGSRDPKRFDYNDRSEILDELFKRQKAVSYSAIAKLIERNNNAQNVTVKGGQGSTGFVSSMTSYNDFCEILEVENLEDENNPLKLDEIEEIILWSTVFEDRNIFKHKLNQKYSEKLSKQQIKKILNKRYSGWGRLSKKFLTEIIINTYRDKTSILDILRDGDPRHGRYNAAMILMEVLGEDDFGFKELIEEENKRYLSRNDVKLTVDDYQGSHAIKRSVNQAMKIIEEIAGIAGHAPSRIAIEVTRDNTDQRNKKETVNRFKKLEPAIKAILKDAEQFDKELLEELKDNKDSLDREKLYLYFRQGGKSLYSGKALDINNLDKYQVDHIIPQAYIKDDSYDNKALVLPEENQRKLDSLLLDTSIIHSQYPRWNALKQAGLMSDKTFNNLTCTHMSDRRLEGFINRQLVETSQSIKFLRQLCEQEYPGTEIVSLRASLSSNLRRKCDLYKSRIINNYHHAHDAYLASQLARFIDLRYPKFQDGFDRNIIDRYIQSLGRKTQSSGKIYVGSAGFIVESFMRDGFDKETGEVFKDSWDAEKEISQLKKCLNYKDCFISRMVEEQTGAFWDQTVYSPRDTRNGKNLYVPLKETGKEGFLDPKKYGGVSTAKRAYFFAFYATDKKGNIKYFFEGMPIYKKQQIESKPELLQEFAEEIANENGCTNAHILREKIPLRQKLILDGDEFYLFGRTGSRNELRCAKEFAGGLKFTEILNRMNDEETVVSGEELTLFYKRIASFLSSNHCGLSEALKLEINFKKFNMLDLQEKESVILNLLNCINNSVRGCDLSILDMSKFSGYILKNLASAMDEIIWIDTSVTGMFEHCCRLKA